MTYATDIDALNPSHAYSLDGNANDRIAANNGTNSGGSFTGVPLCEGVTNSYLTDGISDRISLPSVATINNAAQDRKAVSGWFSATAIQNPPKSIYGEGDGNQSFRIILGWGNNLVFEVDSSSFTLQIFGDVVLDPNRAYHLCAVFEGNGFSNEFRGYLDGVKQLDAAPPDRQPDAATLALRSVGEIGDPSGTVAVGGVVVTLLAPINGQYNEWNMFDGADAVLTDIEARELFEKGALPNATVTTSVESVMQVAYDLLPTSQGNNPLCVRIEAASGISITSDKVFNPLASIHIQYMGTDTLTVINVSGGNAAIGSTPNGGTIIFATEVDVIVTCLDSITSSPIENARVYLNDSGENNVLNGLTNSSGIIAGIYNFISLDVVSSTSKARKGSSSTYYKSTQITGTITNDGLNTTVLMVRDE